MRALIPLTALALTSCRDSLPVYLLTQGFQQGSLYVNARPVKEILEDPSQDPKVKRYLALSERVLAYASAKLGMRTRNAYRDYAALHRRWVSHVVVAAYRDRFEPYLFEYPFFGALPYRGYFQLEDATAFAARLRAEHGVDVYVRPVPAYSTTGWLADPIVSSMFSSETDFIEMLFHELTHLQFYLSGEADFNEAFATWFAQKAARAFATETSVNEGERKAWLDELARSEARDLARANWVRATLAKARAFYASSEFLQADAKTRESLRTALFSGIVESLRHAEGFEKWSRIEWNNAVLVSLSTYQDLVAVIDDYATRQRLSATELLRITREDPASILQALKPRAAKGS